MEFAFGAKVRAFIAFELPAEVRAAIAEYVQPLRTLPGRVSWVKADNIHLTLKFLGDTPEKRIGDIAEALRDIARGTHSIAASLAGTGAFPNERRPRVLWIGLEEQSGALQNLATAIDERMHRLGFEKENRPFSAHLTIGRVRDGSIGKIIKAIRDQPFGNREVNLHEITLMRSALHPGGSIYTPLCKIKLGGS